MPSNVESSSSKEKEEMVRGDLTSRIDEGNSWSGNERNCLFLNHGVERFATASYITGFDFKDDGRGVALVDWDHDGDIDIWLSNRYGPQARYLENQTIGSKWLSLKLIGDGRKVNLDAIGAKVLFWIKDKGEMVPLMRDVACGDSFLSQSTRWLNVGLGGAELVRIEIRWPDGTQQNLDAPDIRSHYTLRYGESEFKKWHRTSKFVLSDIELPEPAKLSSNIKLVGKYPFPPVIFFGSNKLITPLKKGSMKLLKFWSADCDICKKELESIVVKHGMLSEAGVELTLVNVDVDIRGFPAHNQAQVPKVAQLSVGLQGVNVVEAFMNTLRIFHSEFKFPLAILVDSDGRVISFYEGSLDYDVAVKDAEVSSAQKGLKFRNIIPFEGVEEDGLFDSLHPLIASKFANNKHEKYAARVLNLSGEKTKQMVPYKLVLSDLYLKTKRGKKAIPILLEVLKVVKDRQNKKLATRYLGMAYMENRQMGESEKLLKEAAANFNDARSHYYLAKLMFLTGRGEKVENCLLKSIELCEQQGLSFDFPWKQLMKIYKREKRDDDLNDLTRRAKVLGIKL